MQDFRWFATKAAVPAVLLIWFAAAGGGPSRADTAGHMNIDIHDGVPFSAISVVGANGAVGNFMTGIDTWGVGFMVERVWFYHGGNYAESGVPYRVHFIHRVLIEGEETFWLTDYYDRQTTCNYCWEVIQTAGYYPEQGSDEEDTFGVFIQPLGVGVGSRPQLWHDRYANHPHSAALIGVYWNLASNVGSPPGDRDLYGLDYYFSDYGFGEVLLGMEISSDVIVATEPSSFSAVKSLY